MHHPLFLLVASVLLAGCTTGGSKLPDTGRIDDTGPLDDTGPNDDTSPPGDTGVDTGPEPIPFGFWGLNGYHSPAGLVDVQDRFAISVFHTSTYSASYGVGTLLPMVRDAGLRVNLRMAGDHHWYTTEEGDFDIEAWKAMLEPWRGSGVEHFIDEGTLAFHMLLDDIDTFEGRPPTGDELDEMARYSKELLPGLAVAVREEASKLPEPSGGSFEHLDASMNQYMSVHGDVEECALANQQAAAAFGIGIVNGLNIADGGDGSSGQPGWKEGFWAMSAEEIVRYGQVLADVPDITMFLAWEYDAEEKWSDGSIGADYFDQPENTEALRWLALYLAWEETEPPW